MLQRYNPKIDLIFQKIFGSEENKDILLSLLNGVLDHKEPLTEITVKNPYNFANYVKSKTSILDIKAVDHTGVCYNIEMQVGRIGMYGKKALFYLSKLYTDQIQRGEDYALLNTAIGIHLLDFPYFPGHRYKRHLMLMDVESKEIYEKFKYQQLYLIEMPKMTKDFSQLNTLLERWVSFLNRAHELKMKKLPPNLGREKTIIKACEQLEVINFNDEEQRIYELEQKQRMNSKAEWRTAKEEGIEEGLEKGREEGREQGKKKLRATVLKLLKLGVEVNTIAQATGLILEEIKALNNKEDN